MSASSAAGIGLLLWPVGGGLFCWIVVEVLVLAGIVAVAAVDVTAADSVVPLCIPGRGANDKSIAFEISQPVVPELSPWGSVRGTAGCTG